MRFKDWLQKEEITSTACVAGFQNRLMMARRWWVSDWEDEMANPGRKKNKKFTYRVPQVMEGSGYKLSCVMFNLNYKDSEKVLEWSKKNIPEKSLYTNGEKGREDEIHVTVLYGLHDNKPQDVKEIVSKFNPAPIHFGEISKFEAEKYDVIKISVEGSILHKINKALKDLPYTSTHPNYQPHCTLAYVKKGSCDHLIGKKFFQGWKVVLDSVIFSPANGQRSTINLA